MDNNIFKILDFVLKKKKITSSEVKNINSYLLNRWISMTESNNVNILNITSNRWLTRKTNIDIIKFYHAVIFTGCLWPLPWTLQESHFHRWPVSLNAESLSSSTRL